MIFDINVIILIIILTIFFILLNKIKFVVALKKNKPVKLINLDLTNSFLYFNDNQKYNIKVKFKDDRLIKDLKILNKKYKLVGHAGNKNYKIIKQMLVESGINKFFFDIIPTEKKDKYI